MHRKRKRERQTTRKKPPPRVAVGRHQGAKPCRVSPGIVPTGIELTSVHKLDISRSQSYSSCRHKQLQHREPKRVTRMLSRLIFGVLAALLVLSSRRQRFRAAFQVDAFRGLADGPELLDRVRAHLRARLRGAATVTLRAANTFHLKQKSRREKSSRNRPPPHCITVVNQVTDSAHRLNAPPRQNTRSTAAPPVRLRGGGAFSVPRAGHAGAAFIRI